jgi:PAS domain S-box-containing protein
MEDHELTLHQIVEGITALITVTSADGQVSFVNQPVLDYFGKSLDELKRWTPSDSLHPEDLPRVVAAWQRSLRDGQPCEFEHRIRRADGAYLWFQVRGFPVHDVAGRILHWLVLQTDIHERKRAEAVLAGEKHLLERIASGTASPVVLDAICRFVEFMDAGCHCSILLIDDDGATVHHHAAPTLPPAFVQAIDGRDTSLPYWGPCAMAADRKEEVIVADITTDTRWRAFEWAALALAHGLRSCWTTPILSKGANALGTFAIYRREPGHPTSLQQELTDRLTHIAGIAIESGRTAAALRERERESRLVVDSIPGLVATLTPAGEMEAVNKQVLSYCGRTLEELKQWRTGDTVHQQDLPLAIRVVSESMLSGEPYEIVERVRRFDGVYRWFQVRGFPLRGSDERIVRWYVLLTDIDDLKRTEAALAGSERNLSLMINAIPTFIQVSRPDGTVLSVNQTVLDYYGVSIEDVQTEDFRSRVYHPDDVKRLRKQREEGLQHPAAFEYEQRALGRDGEYRWFLVRYKPLLDEKGRIDRWYVAAFDIEDRKRAEAELSALKDRLYKENLVLRDEVDRTSMFEEIVGSSSALQPVLARVAKVAQTDSTVLITGETGTGKELVARAIHRRSARAASAFVAVNCAAIPRELIAAELFGHEKGAFTGATQRRLGRFELAHGGTLFLDEVGDLPMETQVALLRVLQERQFERVGGSSPIRADVRVVAATNGDLQSAIDGGTFRSDLFYRLNVFPIAVPALRERADDIPLLVEYFIDRYARNAGKTIRRVNKRTLDHLRSYPWPGNVRELQNVIERSVIVCDTEEFTVDESWLSARPAIGRPLALSSTVAKQEKALIEDALRACGGRVYGPAGAAARLGIPRSTLESKIRTLKINKNRFRL